MKKQMPKMTNPSGFPSITFCTKCNAIVHLSMILQMVDGHESYSYRYECIKCGEVKKL